MVVKNLVSTVSNEKAVKAVIALKEGGKLPEGLEVMDLRQVLENLSNKKGGQILTVWYLKIDDRPRFDKAVWKLERFQFQLVSYESRASVKEVRAAGKAADTTVVKNEKCIDEKHFLYYNTEKGTYKLRLPTVLANGKPLVLYGLDTDFVSEQEFTEYVNSKYAPKQYGDFVQTFYSLNIGNIICLK